MPFSGETGNLLVWLEGGMVPNSFYQLNVEGRFNTLLMVDSLSTPEQKQRAFQRIKAMPYEDFLETAYWKTIRDFVVAVHNNICQSCLMDRAVDLHHKTY